MGIQTQELLKCGSSVPHVWLKCVWSLVQVWLDCASQVWLKSVWLSMAKISSP